jgi:hypothetical protein
MNTKYKLTINKFNLKFWAIEGGARRYIMLRSYFNVSFVT